jgi:oligoendopeptidase F
MDTLTWDLSDLYKGLDDPALLEDPVRIRERAQAFEDRYRGRIAAADCTPETLREALDEYERINRLRVRPMAYAGLMFSADTSDPARGAMLQRMQQEGTAISRHLLFFELEIGRMPEETFRRAAADPSLAEYRHYLERERLLARHHLTEPEEQIVEELSNTGERAWVRLFSEITSRASFRVRIGDETREMTQSDVLALLYDPDRQVRRAASEAITDTLKQQSHVLTFIYNNLLQQKATMDRLRAYEYPEQERHEGNELSPEVVRNVVNVCVENYAVVAEYYELKRSLLGLDELTHYDRYAPITAAASDISFPQAQGMVLDAFGGFSGEVREMTEPFFSRRWIDAEVRQGKRGGAFCSYIAPDMHPYVFMNYTGKPRDVMTLAHELGHAIHGVLAAKHNFLNFMPTLPLAETASVFGEMLVFERLQERISDPKEKLALLCGKIEDTFATVFRQATMYRFEQAAHQVRRAEGELTTERYNALWQQTMQEMFGDSLTLEEDHAWWWLYIPHVYATPFYVYAYSFGELLVLALYARYKEEGQPFVCRYLDLLAAGGSASPEEMLKEIGIDINRKEFWQGGVQIIREMVQRAKALAGVS